MISVVPPKIAMISVARRRPSRRHRSPPVLRQPTVLEASFHQLTWKPASPAGAARDPFRDTSRYHLQYERPYPLEVR